MARILKNHNRLFTIFTGILALLLVVAIPIVIISLIRPKSTQAAWYDDTWGYRQRIAITNSGSNQTNWQLSFTLNTSALITAGKMQSDCDDIRITDLNGRVLPHWIEENNPGCNNSATLVWTKVPSIETSGQALYVYYGNPSAVNVENGNDVFLFFDNFASNTLGTKWGLESGTWSISGGILSHSVSEVGKVNASIVSISDFAVESRSRITDGTNAWGALSVVMIKTVSVDDIDYNYRKETGAKRAEVRNTVSASTTVNTGTFSYTLNQYHKEVAYKNGSNLKLDIDGSNIINVTQTAASGFVTLQLYNYEEAGDYDYVFLRQAVATPPSAGSPANEEKSQGPVGYWKLDEGSDNTCSGGSNDICNSMNNTALDGASSGGTAWKTADFCVTGKCMWFDGSDDEVAISNSDPIDFDKGLASAVTFQAWVKVNSDGEGNVGRILDKGTNTYLRVTNDGTDGLADLEVKLDLGTAAATKTVTNGIILNKWQLITVGYTDDGDDEITVYIDGATQGSSTDGQGAPTASDANSLIIGGDSGTTGNYNGFIDEVKVYNYERSAAQIATDYSRAATAHGAAGVLGAASTDPLNKGLVGYWKMDETAANSCGSNDSCDSSGNALDGAWTADATAAAGRFGRGVTFDGTGDYVNMGDPASTILDFGTGDFTLAAWFKVTSITTWTSILNKGASGSVGYGLTVSDNVKLSADIQGSAGDNQHVESNIVLSTGTWYHGVAVYKRNDKIRVYVNGVLDMEAGFDAGNDTSVSNNSNFTVGMYTNGSSFPLTGVVDEARVYNRALSPSEVSALASWAPGPVGWWKMDENSGSSSTLDSSGNGLNATIGSAAGFDTNDPSWASGKYGSALNFDGSDNYIDAGDTPLVDFGDGDYTLEAWIKPDSLTQTRGIIIGKDNSTSGTRQFTLEWDAGNDNSNVMRTAYFKATDTPVYADTGSNSISDTNWHHVVGMRSGNSFLIYIDGVSKTVTTTGTHGTMQPTTANIRIGNRQYASTPDEFDGSIDDVRIYNYARTQKQVTEDMNAGHPPVGSPVGSPVGYWKFDEGADNTCSGGTNDVCNSGSGGSALDGAENSMAIPATADSGWTASGKYNKALAFDGTGDYVTVANNAALTLTGDMSFGAWVNADTITDGEFIMTYAASGETQAANKLYGMAWYTLSGGNDISLSHESGGGSDTDVTFDTNLSTGRWYHLFVVRNSTAKTYSLYIDGKLFQTQSYSTNPDGGTSSTLQIGTDLSGFNHSDGKIDEVQIYSYALTDAEVKTVYNANVSTNFGTGTTETANFSDGAPSSPVLWWKFDENSGATALDSSGNGRTGTMTNFPQWVPGKSGSALNFDGTNEHVSYANSILGNSSAFSISVWFKTGNTSNEVLLREYNSSVSTQKILININESASGDFDFDVVDDSGTNGSCTNGTAGYNDNKWHHLVAIQTGKSYRKAYVDGILTCENSTTVGTLTLDSFRVGLHPDNSSLDFIGNIDDIRIYNTALTVAQVLYLYNRGAPVAWYKFDECQGTTANNSAPDPGGGDAGNDGTITPGDTSGDNDTAGTCGSGTSTEMWNDGTTGKFNSALGFDGTNDYVDLSSPAILDDLPTADFTVSAWIYDTQAAVSTWGTVISTYEDVPTAGWQLRTVSNGSGARSLYFQAVHTGSAAFQSPDGSIPTNAWTHVVAVWNVTTKRAKLYINGSEPSSYQTENAGSGSYTTDNTYEKDIGRLPHNSGQQYFSGLIDDVRIYKYVLSPAQVKLVYNGSFEGLFGPLTGSP